MQQQTPVQQQLPFITYYDGPRLVEPVELADIDAARVAVRRCWDLRTRTHMTRRQLAEETGTYPSHISDYLAPDSKGGTRRDLPLWAVEAFEVACGNRAITQWMAQRAGLTILESLRRAA